VIGLGRLGLQAASVCATHPGYALAALVDARAATRRFARGCGFTVPVEARLARALAREEADAAVVCAPPAERAALAAAALDANLAVLVAHPVAESAADARALAVRAQGRDARVMSPTAFQPLAERARAMLAAGELGAIEQVHVSVYVSRVFGPGARPPRGDALDHFGVDALLLIDRLFGPALAVEASGHRLYGEGFDEAHARLTHASGLVTGLDVSWSVPGYPRPATVIEVKGSRGHLLVSDDALELAPALAPGEAEAPGLRVVAAELPSPARFDAGGDDVWLAMEAFRADVASGAATRPDDPLDLARSARVVELLAELRRVAEKHGAEGRRS
jgi:predicted dehydrogenase